VIAPPSGMRVLMAAKPVDFRKGANGLAALIKDEMKADPFSGVVYVFRAKRGDRIKLLYWDGSGVVLMANYLASHCSSFRWRLAS
jgi:transposase